LEEFKIVNKIVSLKNMCEIADYLEAKNAEYNVIFEEDKRANQDLAYGQKKIIYDNVILNNEYTIELHNGKIITETDVQWFKEKIKDSQDIKSIRIYQAVSYWYNDRENTTNDLEYNSIPTHLYTTVYFYEDRITITVDGKEKEQEVKDTYTFIRDILENNESRYNSTIKNRNLRIQSFCISLGLVISYIIGLILLIKFNDIKQISFLYQLIANKFAIVGLQWIIAILAGNIIGKFFMDALYRDILPGKRYLTYDNYSEKSVYVDDIEDYKEKDEVQIGKFHDSLLRREKIEKIYKVSRIIVLAQVVVSIIIMLIF